ncbi:tripartite tricarboxylate transporter substrate binding protein [Sutterella sp.]|uniref:Bug family tripartite tricarboxylate transporter substrate binding protein n=1 Tax=Sutterella sp. TaxID=1981025 RepID=UPI0026E11157|nr:tripartite tricarboxylate transporter substrate binding protein [Sutterella sp.]MDO5531309.1 tripartite tricarboxylate transporter substrate binding protein [Sutterella sp.]
MQRRTVLGAIGAVALSSATYFPMTACAAALKGDSGNPIRIVVPYPPGGPLDVSARAIADAISPAFGTVVVENRPGAGGNVGMSFVKQQKPDGHTLVMGAVATHAINPSLYKNIPYDPKKDFKPVSLVATAANVLVITPQFSEKTGIKSVADLIAYAKANPGKLNYASGGNGSAGHMAGELLKNKAGIDMAHIPFAGASPALLSVISGQTDLIFDNLASASANIKAGKLMALAVTTKTRTPLLADTPTMGEAGVPDFDIYTWFGLMVPGKTPDETVAELNAEIVKALRDPAMDKKFRAFGALPAPNTPAEFAQMIDDEAAKYKVLVKISGARVD